MDIKNILQKLTLAEKASLCAGSDSWHTRGIKRLDIPTIMMADGPHGLRKELSKGNGDILRDSYPATCFPTASALASTWNRELISKVAQAIAEECLAEGVSVVLGPGTNIKRSPLCGRNFEYFSEDPYQMGEMATAYIQGVQQMGVGASLKHFAANNQEYRRMLIDTVVDERALREIYMAGFETAVKNGKPWTVMAAYNRLNGMYCTENAWLLETVLRKEWGFEGIVISDWGAVNDRVVGITAGMDLEMPGIENGNKDRIISAVQSGELLEKDLDNVVRRLLRFVDRCSMNLQDDFRCDLEAHHRLAMKTATEGAVLLKNEGDLLPLSKTATVGLIGQFAKIPRYQGSGSSLINPSRMDTLYDAMREYAGIDKVIFAKGYSLDEKGDSDALLAEAIDVARKTNVVVVCAGLTDMDEVESVDRQHLRLADAHDQLIEAIAEANPQTIVLLSNGSPVEMPWIDKVPAVLEGYLGGQAGASAHCQLIYGEENPSGKLAESFPISLQDTPAHAYFPGGPKTVEYRESLFVGYRFYDTVETEVLFPFGHGLSYTRFVYKNLVVIHEKGNLVNVCFDIENVGDRAGKEIAQVYVHAPREGVARPEQELKGFVKVALDAGETQTVNLALGKRAFAYYSVKKHDWQVQKGKYEIRVGASSRDIRLTSHVQFDGENPETLTPSEKFYRHFPADADVPQAVFEGLLGRALPNNGPISRPYDLNTSIMDMQRSLVGRFLKRIIRRQINAMMGEEIHGPTRLMIEQMALESPLRVLVMFSGGALSRRMLNRLLMLANGRMLSKARQRKNQD